MTFEIINQSNWLLHKQTGLEPARSGAQQYGSRRAERSLSPYLPVKKQRLWKTKTPQKKL